MVTPRRARSPALVAGLVLWGLFAQAQETAPAEVATPAFVWEVACRPEPGAPRDLGCAISKTLIVPETGRRMLKIDLLPAADPQTEATTLRLLFPHGLRLDAVVGLQIDDGRLYKLPLTRSAPEGVYAVHPLGRDVVASLRRGRELKISAVTEAGQVLTLPVSLYGFSAALDAIAQIRARASQPAP